MHTHTYTYVKKKKKYLQNILPDLTYRRILNSGIIVEFIFCSIKFLRTLHKKCYNIININM